VHAGLNSTAYDFDLNTDYPDWDWPMCQEMRLELRPGTWVTLQ